MMAVKFELINMASHFVNNFLRIECIMYNEEEQTTKSNNFLIRKRKNLNIS
jgi:hypothetical protein